MFIRLHKKICLFLCCFFLAGIAVAWAQDRPVRVSLEELETVDVLLKREAALEIREAEVEKREQSLMALEKEVNEKLDQVLALQNDIGVKLSEIKAEQDASFKQLIKVYSSMSASKLAPLLNQMTDENVTSILRSMKTDFVAQIMPKLDGEKAVRVSRLLGRFN